MEKLRIVSRMTWAGLIRRATAASTAVLVLGVTLTPVVQTQGWDGVWHPYVLLLTMLSLLPSLLFLVFVRGALISLVGGMALLVATAITYTDIATDDSSTAAIRFLGAWLPAWIIVCIAIGIDNSRELWSTFVNPRASKAQTKRARQ